MSKRIVHYYEHDHERRRKQWDLGINNRMETAHCPNMVDSLRGANFDVLYLYWEPPADDYGFYQVIMPVVIGCQAEIIRVSPGHNSPLWRVLNGEDV